VTVPYLHVIGMQAPPSSLLRPGVALRVLRHALARPAPAVVPEVDGTAQPV
jgi:hypothetical protein